MKIGASNSLDSVKIQCRQARWATCLVTLCLAAVLVSTNVQTAHFCGFRKSNGHSELELEPAASARSCMFCLMAPSASSIVLLIALLIGFGNSGRVGILQVRPSPIIESFLLYIRPLRSFDSLCLILQSGF